MSLLFVRALDALVLVLFAAGFYAAFLDLAKGRLRGLWLGFLLLVLFFLEERLLAYWQAS